MNIEAAGSTSLSAKENETVAASSPSNVALACPVCLGVALKFQKALSWRSRGAQMMHGVSEREPLGLRLKTALHGLR